MKYFKNKLLVLLLLFNISAVNSSLFAGETAKWTIMIYAQADSILNNFAAKNFHAMATVGSSENLNIITQWNQPRKGGTWRYKIEKNKMTLVDSRAKTAKRDFSQDLIDFATFTSTNYPAEKYILILWNHGIGILDPEWGQLHNFAINPATLGQNPRAQIEGITCNTTDTHTISDTFYTNTACNNITFSGQYCEDMSTTDTRGILFDMANRNYLTNQGLTSALNHITTNVIKKKFAIIGMDACLEAMLEVFYQIKDSAHYVVSSEEVELAQGWNYIPFLHALATTQIEEEELAKIIVHTFEDFYKGRTRFYTQSAIDLNRIDFLKQNLDQVVGNIMLCKKSHSKKITHAIQKARQECFQLSVSCYIDLYSFYTKLKKQLDKIKGINNREFKALKSSLANGMRLIDNIVIANVSSNYLSQAKGISIYYPRKTIDRSYFQTAFVQDSLWLPFLQQIIK